MLGGASLKATKLQNELTGGISRVSETAVMMQEKSGTFFTEIPQSMTSNAMSSFYHLMIFAFFK